MEKNNFDLPITGKISILPSDNGKVRVSDPDDTTSYFLLRKQDIRLDFTLSSEDNLVPLKITEGALVELHYKSLAHSFINSVDEQAFYVDTKEEKLVYLENQSNFHSTSGSCTARTSGFYKLKCCNSDHHFKGIILPPTGCPGMNFPKDCCSGVIEDSHGDL